jgi:hypothetical protein
MFCPKNPNIESCCTCKDGKGRIINDKCDALNFAINNDYEVIGCYKWRPAIFQKSLLRVAKWREYIHDQGL